MASLIITVGLPASGKTTRAFAWMVLDPFRRVRVNRDDLRVMMVGGWTGRGEHEAAVTEAQHGAIAALLPAGLDVVVDDTNLYAEHVEAFRDIAVAFGATFEIWDMTSVPVDTCVERDAARAAAGKRAVGEQVIRSMHQRWLERQRLAAVGERNA